MKHIWHYLFSSARPQTVCEVTLDYRKGNERKVLTGLNPLLDQYEGHGLIRLRHGKKMSVLFESESSAKSFVLKAHRLKLPVKFAVCAAKDV